jgi:hypothetical protein
MEGQPFSIALHDKVSARCESKIVDVITADSILEHIDGKGIDPVILREGGLEGHLGMRGMRERTKLIGAPSLCGVGSFQEPRSS